MSNLRCQVDWTCTGFYYGDGGYATYYNVKTLLYRVMQQPLTLKPPVADANLTKCVSNGYDKSEEHLNIITQNTLHINKGTGYFNLI